MSVTEDTTRAEFIEEINRIDDSCSELCSKLVKFCNLIGVVVESHSYRVKKLEKFTGKITKGGSIKFNDLSKVKDAGGIRLVFRSRKDEQLIFDSISALKGKNNFCEWAVVGDDIKDNETDDIYKGKHIPFLCHGKKFQIELQLRTMMQDLIYNAMHEIYDDGFKEEGLLEALVYFVKQAEFVGRATSLLSGGTNKKDDFIKEVLRSKEDPKNLPTVDSSDVDEPKNDLLEAGSGFLNVISTGLELSSSSVNNKRNRVDSVEMQNSRSFRKFHWTYPQK